MHRGDQLDRSGEERCKHDQAETSAENALQASAHYALENMPRRCAAAACAHNTVGARAAEAAAAGWRRREWLAGYGPGGGPGAEDIGDEDSTDNQGFDPEQGISLNLIEIGKLRLYPHGIVDRG